MLALFQDPSFLAELFFFAVKAKYAASGLSTLLSSLLGRASPILVIVLVLTAFNSLIAVLILGLRSIPESASSTATELASLLEARLEEQRRLLSEMRDSLAALSSRIEETLSKVSEASSGDVPLKEEGDESSRGDSGGSPASVDEQEGKDDEGGEEAGESGSNSLKQLSESVRALRELSVELRKLHERLSSAKSAEA